MKFLKSGLGLAVVGATLSVIPGSGSAAVGAPLAAKDPSAVSQMRAAAEGDVRVTTDRATGKVGFVGARGAQDADLLPGVAANDRASAAAKAATYLQRYGSAFGLADGQLEQTGVVQDRYGYVVSFAQEHRGVPVFGGVLKATVDKAGDLGAVSGFAAPGLTLSVDPAVSAAKAGARAVSVVRAEPPTHDHDGELEAADTTGIRAVSTELVVYRNGALRGVDGEAVLAYVIEVSNAKNVRDVVVLDANTNKPLNRWSTIHSALDRELYEASGTRQNPVLTKVWEEGQSTESLNTDQRNLVNSAGESYWMFRNSFGADSYDLNGATMRTVNNDPRISCPNANWNGVTTNYCDGVTSDDIVSHEWGHAYTEYTSGLIYQYQPGALNESYSDVWGETLDIVNGREDENESFTTKRTDGDCGADAPPGVEMTITAPASVAGPCFAVAASGAKEFPTTPVTAEVVVATDAANDAGPSATDGCSTFTNAAAVAAKWAYVDRGTCPFVQKVANAEAAGATGIVIGNNNTDIPAGFTGDPDLYGVMVGQDDGARIKSVGTVTATVTAEDTSARPETTRWLIGEKSEAFGGAIRDMWNPTCYGDPGKVSDAEYKCDPLLTDSGGVHSNSGVPNKAYALVVDGGTSNGRVVAPLGIDKAAAIWWRAQSAYLTPSSNFNDAADAWEQSCTDLVGQDINVVSTEPSAEKELAADITAADCASVTAAIAATEMRSSTPERCNFRPILAKNAPKDLCGEGMKTRTVWTERFEDGLVGWEKDQELADLGGYQGGFGAPWRATENAPEGREGGVAYGPAPDRGDCSGDGVNDFSSRDTIISPAVNMPNRLKSAKLSFDHYVATEAGYDGGNLKVSVNESRFNVVDPAAYVFNKPNTTLTPAPGGTSPIAGQPGFSGTDGGEVKGSWGTSIVDVSAIGVKAGDEVRFRFDMGRDGCGGIDGWYLDNLKLVACSKVATTVRTTTRAMAPLARKFRKDFTVRAQVSKATGGAAKGRVAVLHNGNVVGLGRLQEGRVAIPVRKDFRPGRVTLRARYLGNDNLRRSSDTTTTRIYR